MRDFDTSLGEMDEIKFKITEEEIWRRCKFFQFFYLVPRIETLDSPCLILHRLLKTFFIFVLREFLLQSGISVRMDKEIF